MSSEQTLKKYALVGAIILPILLILTVWIASGSTGKLEPPPEYNFLYSLPDGSYRSTVQIIEEYGQLKLKYLIREKDKSNEMHLPALFVYNVATKEAVQISYQIQGDMQLGRSWQYLPIKVENFMPIISGKEAPDGYKYEYRHRSGIWYGLFGHSGGGNHVIYKDSNVLIFSRKPGYQLNFLGWLEGAGDDSR